MSAQLVFLVFSSAQLQIDTLYVFSSIVSNCSTLNESWEKELNYVMSKDFVGLAKNLLSF